MKFILLLLLFSQAAFPTTVTKPTTITINASSGACSSGVSSGPLTVTVTGPRTSGVSPFTAFFDATATTDASVPLSVPQDVTFTWSFGDGSPVSGSSTWLYGAHPNANSRNSGSGIATAHMYYVPDGAGDQNYTVTLNATDGTNAVSCTYSVTAFDPIGTNGFATQICQSQSGNFTGCPTGATHSTSAVMSANINTSMSNKRVLFACGDTFTGGVNFNGTKFALGAYGGCQNTATSRPIMSGAFTTPGGADDSSNFVNVMISDLDFESSGSAVSIGFPISGAVSNQVTLYNLKSTGNNTSYYIQQSAQLALIQDFQSGMGTQQGTYIQVGQNNCSNQVLNAYPCATGVYFPVTYVAVQGSHFDGTGATGSGGVETVRVSACRFCSFTNSDYLNANTIGAVLKFHNGNTFDTQCIWTGQWTEYVELSDNFFGGQSGAQLVEVSPQNQVTDERLRYFVIERNVFHQAVGSNDALSTGIMNGTIRDNVFNKSSVTTIGVKLGNRGFQGTSNNTSGGTCAGSGTTSAPVIALYPQFDEVYNNTCYAGGTCFAFSGGGEFNGGPGNNSVAQNNLVYLGTVSTNSGSGNTIGSNTVTTTNNPGFTNGSGTFNVISDFKPTANFSGALNGVPVQFDALGFLWTPTWDLGAVKH